MDPKIIDTEPRHFGPEVAVGSMEFMRFIMRVDETLSDGVTSWRNESVERRDGSEIDGRGLFATRDIDAHELIAIKAGRVVNEAEVRRLTAEGEIHGSQQQIDVNLFLVGLNEVEEDKNLIGYNHSCNPNAFFVWSRTNQSRFGTAFLVSRKDIKAGEEITTDYSVSHISNTHRMVCNCQSPDCRVLIQPRYDYMHPEFQEKYKVEMPEYIQELIDDLKDYPEAIRNGVLYAAYFEEIIGRIVLIAGEIDRLGQLPDDDDSLKRMQYFQEMLFLSSAYLVSHYPDTAKKCGINTKNFKKFQKSISARQINIVEFAREADKKVGWM